MRTLEVVVQLWRIDNPNAGIPVEAKLVGRYLRGEIASYDLAAGAVVAVVGGPSE